MRVYLVRHGRPKSEREDPARPLSEAGRREITELAKALAHKGIAVAAIRHSVKLRARQTAEILAASLDPPGGCSQAGGLRPLDDPEEWRDRIEAGGEDIMLVGHLPHLDRLASLLLAQRGEGGLLPFAPGAVACLTKDEIGSWLLQWFVEPYLLEKST